MDNMDKVMALRAKIEAKKTEIDSLEQEVSDALADVIKEKGTSFGPINDVYYNVRTRASRNFLCGSPVPFGSWLKGKPRPPRKPKETIVPEAPPENEDSILVATENA